MNSPHILAPKGETPYSLLEQGIEQIVQQRHDEGLALLVLAREQLVPRQANCLPFLDEIIQSYTYYNQAQKRLLEASREFTGTEKALQVSLHKLKQALTIAQPAIHTVAQPYESTCNSSIVSPPASPALLQALPCPHALTESDTLPELSITCFGRFEVRRGQQLLTLCQNRSGQAILRYLITQSGYRATIDGLMELYWPEDEPKAARHKLQVAVSALRRSLNGAHASESGSGYILCKHMSYAINPEIVLTTDVDSFLSLFEMGKHAPHAAEMVVHYAQACQLYTGPFLVEDTYADWSFTHRERFSHIYRTMCGTLTGYALKTKNYEEALRWANALLAENHCDEEAHRYLMLAYAGQGRRNDAMHQYRRCERILHEELGVALMPETVHVFEDILLGNEHRAKLEQK